MAKRITVPGTILLVGLALGACQSAGPPPPAPPAPPPPPPAPVAPPPEEGTVPATPPIQRYVYLKYTPAQAEAACSIAVLDERTNIFMSHSPSLVEWQVVDPDDDHQWVIEQKGGEGRFRARRFVIPCRGNKAHRSGRPTGEGTWTYKVSVFECTGGQAASEPACVRDPDVIIWK